MGPGEREWDGRPIWDRAVLRQHAGGDSVLVARLVGAFLTEAPLRLGEILNAAVREDFPEIVVAARALRGSAAMIAGQVVRGIAEALVEAATAADAGATGQLIRLLDDALGELLQQIRASAGGAS